MSKERSQAQKEIKINATRSGDAEFWNAFFAFYLNRSQLSLSTAYKLAKERMRKEKPLALIPTLHQARYQVCKLDPAAVCLARYGQAELAKAVEGYIEPEGAGK